jgi:peptidoglycan biosynthesis protein MviN/MurJ (putative lipid II flippase)
MVMVNLGLDLLLVGPLGELGLACATSITLVLTAVWMMLGVRRQLESPQQENLLSGMLPAVFVVALMAAAVTAIDQGLVAWLGATRDVAFWRVAAGTLAGVVICVLLAPRVCPKEWRELSTVWRKDD